MSTTLAESLKPVSVDFETLHKNYHPLLALVKELIGVVPNCDPVLEIWKPGFRTYNLLVPNMFNLPNTLFGNKSFKASIGLAMYASSKAACAYCTAHACSFALRRGASAAAITGSRTPKEQAVVALAEGLARVPAQLTMAEMKAVRDHFSSEETEWLVYAISMMGFLNKLMNALGVELEQDAINDVGALLAQTGWKPGINAPKDYRITKSAIPQKDSLFTYMRVIKQAPGAVLWERKWTRGVPDNYKAAAGYLLQHTGYSFPVLKNIGQPRVIRTLTVVLRENLNKDLSVTGLKVKMLAGYFFALLSSNDMLKIEMKNAAAALVPELDTSVFGKLHELVYIEIPADTIARNAFITLLQQKLVLTEKDAAAMLLAIAAAQHPAQLNEAIIETVLERIKPAAVVETITWLSVLQLLQRLSSYYTLIKAKHATALA